MQLIFLPSKSYHHLAVILEADATNLYSALIPHSEQKLVLWKQHHLPNLSSLKKIFLND